MGLKDIVYWVQVLLPALIIVGIMIVTSAIALPIISWIYFGEVKDLLVPARSLLVGLPLLISSVALLVKIQNMDSK